MSGYVHSVDQDSDLFNVYLITFTVGKCQGNFGGGGIKKALHKPFE